MLTTCKRFLLARATMLALLVALLASVLVASLVPQSFLTAEPEMLRWRETYPAVAAVSGVFGFHHVFTSWWFAGILALSLVSMSVSAVEQGRQAWRRTFLVGAAPPSGGALVPNEEVAAAAAREAGYIPLPAGSGRFVRHPWGYWGNCLLHLGLVVTVASSLVIALSQQRGSLVLIKGEPHHPDEPWGVEENGLLAGTFVFPYVVELMKVEPEFLPAGKVRQIRSEVKVAGAEGGGIHEVAVNSMLSLGGVHIYQSTDFGHAFRVDFTGTDGQIHHFTIPVFHPQSLKDAGYRDLRLPISPARLEAKYLADEKRTSLMHGSPLLTLRLVENERETGRVTLHPGDSGQLGPFPVRLVEVTQWTDLIFVRITGMPGVFCGFALIILGTVFTYCLPPREFRLVRQGGAWHLSWRAERFSDFYGDERDEVFSRLTKRGD